MARLPIKQIPNQSISTIIEEINYDLVIRTIGDITYVTISIDGDVKAENVKACINQPILGYDYQHQDAGNFIFTSNDDAYPSYQNFNVSTELQYITIDGDIL